ncbi:MAG TPA: hypothetical protein VN652_02645, partial [Geobacteraceae bacterium]|nr:hypothetical protein [Geobacteraceae bacterium]
DSTSQPLKINATSPSPALKPVVKPAENALPVIQKPPQPPRALSVFSPTLKLGGMVLDEDTEWNGSLRIEGMVTVSPQSTLTVAPGSVIRFAANSGILVYGRIAIKGTPESPVFISSMYDEPRPSDWNGIFLIGTEKNNVFDHCVIQGADTAIQASFSAFAANSILIDNSDTALKLSNSTVTVRNSSLSSSATGILAVKSEVDLEAMTVDRNRSAISLQSSSLAAVNVRLRNNTQTALVADKSQLKLDRMLFSFNLNGLKTTECDGSIINSRFLSNNETAAIFTASHLKFSDNHVSGSRVGVQLDDNNPTLWRNSISGNSSYNLLYLGDERYFAGGNWLGEIIPDSAEIPVFSRQPGALLTAPLLAVDPYPPVTLDSTKATD